jgi:hypothetical protein
MDPGNHAELGMRNKRAIVILLCALSLPAPASADGMGDMFGFMFRMMLTMMNIMADSMNGSNSWNSWNSPFNSYGMGSGGWPLMGGLSGFGGWPVVGGWPGGFGASPWTPPVAANPWASPLGLNPFAGMGYGLPVTQRWGGPPGAWNGYARTSLLEGTWYGTSGEILEVRGNRFILRNSVTSLAGSLDVDDSLVRMYTPQTGAVNVYQFARSESELLLEDPGGGQLLFYRRPYAAALPVSVF